MLESRRNAGVSVVVQRGKPQWIRMLPLSQLANQRDADKWQINGRWTGSDRLEAVG
jgi:hypothetical protein